MGVGCPGNTTNCGNKPQQLKVTFAFGVNSVCTFELVHKTLDLLRDPMCTSLPKGWN